jgi:membrane dipeptidase
MNRRQFLKSGALAGAGLVAAPMLNLGRVRLFARAPGREIEISTAAADLVLASTPIDMLGLLTLDWDKLFGWFERPELFREADYRLLERSGVKVFHPAVDTSQRDAYTAALRWMAGWNHLLSDQGCFLARVDVPSDLVRVPEDGEIGVILGFQNSNHFRTTLDVQAFYALGQRVSLLTYNPRNRLGCGAYVRHDRGLTRFGAEVVAEMNRLGMAVDVAHCGERTSLDAIAASRRPVLITHANCKALVPGHPRCKSDRVIRAMAASGGVMGITVVRAFVSRKRHPTIDDVLDHYDHVARLVGVEHVGMGSDTDVTEIRPRTGRLNPFYAIRGLDPVARVFQIADGLLDRGYSKQAVGLVLGGNFRRALGEIWRHQPASVRAREAKRRDPFCPAPRQVVPR